jgi:zinc transporter 2
MVQSVGVIIAAVLIYFKPEWKRADPICTFLFSILVIFTTIPVMADCIKVLMEGVP